MGIGSGSAFFPGVRSGTGFFKGRIQSKIEWIWNTAFYLCFAVAMPLLTVKPLIVDIPSLHISSVADPDNFDVDPDPTSEKNRIRIRPLKKTGSDHVLYKIL
jgi:hypothetical protein